MLSCSAAGTSLVLGGCRHLMQGGWRPKKRWRGANSLGMFLYGEKFKGWCGRFNEWDFEVLAKYGFNFVRFPIDYRYLTKKGGPWNEPGDEETKALDRGVEFARKRGIHVQVCFHRIPGFTVAGYDHEKYDLFKDKEALDAACAYWRFLARRYRDISNDEMSFNLFNEPNEDYCKGQYPRIARALIKAIREEDPKRFVMLDGLSSRGVYLPVSELNDIPNIGWAGRGYHPMSVSHYGSKYAPVSSGKPVWPLDPDAPSGTFSAKSRTKDFAPFELLYLPPCRVEVSLLRVATCATMRATADGKVMVEKAIVPDEKSPEWKNVAVDPKWHNKIGEWQGKLVVELPEGARKLTLENVKGEWAVPGTITVVSSDGAKRTEIKPIRNFDMPHQFTQRFRGWTAEKCFLPVDEKGRDVARRYPDDSREYLYRTHFKYWDEVVSTGCVTMAGEFGVLNHTPHAMVLDFFEAYLKLWKERDMGWAIWNIGGENGFFNSGRKDVAYEDSDGKKLDRKMLELLQRY